MKLKRSSVNSGSAVGWRESEMIDSHEQCSKLNYCKCMALTANISALHALLFTTK